MNNIVTTNTNTEVVVVTAPGPSGPPGPTGPIGEPGTIQTNSGTIVSPFLIVDGFVVITGSLTVSGSNTFRNIGPALFTGSTGILGNLTVDGTSSATVFSGSGALLTGIPSTGITGLNLSRVATGSISASVNTGTTSFTLNNGGTNLFTVSNTGLGTFTNGLTVSGAVANLNNGLNVSVGNTVINSPNIQLIGSATLNGQPITAGDLTLDKIKSGAVTASVSTGADAFTLESAGTTLFKVSNTGILSGSGANLFNIPASGITGLNLSQIGSGSYTASISDNRFKVNTDSEITGSLTVTGVISGNGSGLTNVPASGVVGLNLSQIATGSVTSSVNVGSTPFSIISGSSTLLSLDSTGLAVVSSSINIGNPTDGGYSTGFFDTFTNNTKVSDAIDEISAAFLDLAPAKAGTLVGTNLTVSSPSVFSGYLAGGLNSSDWYVGTSAYNLISNLTSTTTVTLNTPDNPGVADRFRAGKNSDRVAGTLVGGVSSSKATGSATLAVLSTRALTSGTGSTGTVQITNIAQYNTFWVKANARINDTLTVTGSYKYTVSADNGAGTTNTYQLWYVGGVSDYPNQTVTAATPVTSSTTFNYLSGIPYLKTATFTLGVTGSNLFNPVYNQNQISFTSTYFSTLSTGSNSPNFNDTLLLTVTRTLASNLTSNQNLPTFTITGTKPNKSNATVSPTLVSQKVNSYAFAQSTNNNNTQTEVFLDEARRYENLQTTSWDSAAALTDGNLQVQNGILINGRWGDYGSFVSGSTSAATTYANYFRDSIPGTANRIGGTFSIVRNGSAFAASTPISAWNSGGRLEAALVLKSDITGPETANVYYDLGRVVGDNLPPLPATPVIVGIRNTITTNNTTTYTVTWALPGGVNTGANGCVVWIRYRNTPNTDYITSLTITYS
jgi:hypothetical protein